jgi:hypothetical protein
VFDENPLSDTGRVFENPLSDTGRVFENPLSKDWGDNCSSKPAS